MESNFTLLKRPASPVYQSVLVLLLGWLGMFFCHYLTLPAAAEYFVALTVLIFYTLINTIISIGHASFLRYTLPSYYLYIMLIVILFYTARYLTGISIWTLDIYRMMLTSVTIFYFVVSTLVRVIRLVYDAAQEGL